MPDTPTLSPAARERVDAAMRDLERAAFDPFRPYNPDPARAALTATVAALVAEAEARGREAGAAERDEARALCAVFLMHENPSEALIGALRQQAGEVLVEAARVVARRRPTPTEGDPR